MAQWKFCMLICEVLAICYYFGFDLESANVICRQLGHSVALGVAQFYEFNDGSGQISCTGSVSSLDQCSHSEFGTDIVIARFSLMLMLID